MIIEADRKQEHHTKLLEETRPTSEKKLDSDYEVIQSTVRQSLGQGRSKPVSVVKIQRKSSL